MTAVTVPDTRKHCNTHTLTNLTKHNPQNTKRGPLIHLISIMFKYQAPTILLAITSKSTYLNPFWTAAVPCRRRDTRPKIQFCIIYISCIRQMPPQIMHPHAPVFSKWQTEGSSLKSTGLWKEAEGYRLVIQRHVTHRSTGNMWRTKVWGRERMSRLSRRSPKGSTFFMRKPAIGRYREPVPF
jgi:hypothetical protein